MPDTALPLATPTSRTALGPWLEAKNEVLRSAALRALIASDIPIAEKRTQILASLLDPDPDIRTDAMDGLEHCALPEDAPTIQFSLEGDPVREIKLAAVRLLGTLKSHDSRTLLRKLVLSRSEDLIAWEDELGDWDDWLDIQIAAIVALGHMGATDAIEDIFTARDEEGAQTLDIPVFEALAKMGFEGVTWLLAIIETEGGLSPKRAAKALLSADKQALDDHRAILMAHSSAALRVLAAETLSLSPDDLEDLAAGDPDVSVRCAALTRLDDPSRWERALNDPAPAVKAAALDALDGPFAPEFLAALTDNLIAWLASGDSTLAAAAARHLPRMAGQRAAAPLLQAAATNDHPLEVRVAAVRALSDLDEPLALDDLAGMLASPASQVRITALQGLRPRIDTGDDASAEVVAQAILGTRLSPEQAVLTPPPETGSDAAMPKEEGAANSHVRIGPDGQILRTQAPENGANSTLASILATPEAEEVEDSEEAQAADAQAEVTPEESSGKRRKRRPVEGPDAVADALCVEAVQSVIGCNHPTITIALKEQAAATESTLRRAIWQALSQLGAEPDLDALAHIATADEDPVVRHMAFLRLLQDSAPETVIAKALIDSDPLIRALAIEALSPNAALDYLSDTTTPVRQAAMLRCLSGDAECQTTAADRLVQAERADTLSNLCAQSTVAYNRVLARLCEANLAGRKALVLLNALAGRA